MTDKLYLRKEMIGTWLIQRLQKPYQVTLAGVTMDNPFSFGGGLINGGLSKEAMGVLRTIFSFDYMGSSEFEWGAVPAALSFLAQMALDKNLTHGEVEISGKTVYWIAPKPYADEVVNRIKLLADDEHKHFHLKEWCALKEVLKPDPKKKWNPDYHGWLELDNGFMFFVDKTMYESVLKLFFA